MEVVYITGLGEVVCHGVIAGDLGFHLAASFSSGVFWGK